MADDGPPQRPPFNDPHDPRWYSDPASRGAGTQGTGSHAAGSPPVGPAGAVPPPLDYGTGQAHSPRDGGRPYGSPGYGGPVSPTFGPLYSQQYGAYAPAEPRGLSIAALALGAAAVFTGGVLLIPQILAVVFGHIALRREPAGKPLALTGLIMGYVMLLASVIVIVGFLGLLIASATVPVPAGP